MLMIPFVPTTAQRQKLETTLSACKGITYLVDGEELEIRLFEFPHIVTRFFPSVVIAFPPYANEIRFMTNDSSKQIATCLESVKTGNKIPLVASSNVACYELTNLIITTLKLPEFIIVTANNLLETRERIHWRLSIVEGSKQIKLEPEMTIGEIDFSKEGILRLFFHLEMNQQNGYQTSSGQIKRVYYLHSNIWTKEQMNENLIWMPGIMGSIMDNKTEVVSRYIDWHIADLIRQRFSKR